MATTSRLFETQIHAAFGAVLGAGVAYSLGGRNDIVSMAIGAGIGYFVHPILVSQAGLIPVVPAQFKALVPAAAAGGFIAYNLYPGPDYVNLALGAAAGAGAQYAVTAY